MATVLVQQHTLHHSTPPPSPLPSALNVNRRPSPVPNKHIPVCPTGPSPAENSSLESPVPKTHPEQPSSLLYPPDAFVRISQGPSPAVFAIEAETLAAALSHAASQPMPDPAQMFPWLHGLHPDNHVQLGFFSTRKRASRRTPRCYRGITVVKLGGDLSRARLKGAVCPSDIAFIAIPHGRPTRGLLSAKLPNTDC